LPDEVELVGRRREDIGSKKSVDLLAWQTKSFAIAMEKRRQLW
jgi:hypothetical protein